MSVIEIEDLRAQRKGHVDAMRTIQAAADNAERELTAEEVGEFEKREEAYASVSADIDRREKLEGFAVDAVTPAEENPAKRDSAISEDPKEQAEIEIRAFEKILKSKGDMSRLDKEERAALQVGTDSEGGITVPEAFANQLIESMREFGVVSGLATHITTAESGDLTVPTVSANSTAAWTAEESPYTESEGTFGSVVLKAYKLGDLSKISDELIHDSAFDLLSWLAKDHGEALGLKAGNAYAVGASNSTTTPRGLVPSVSAGVTTNVNTGFTASELIDTYHSVIAPYRKNASWLMNDATVAVIRKFTEAVNGQYLWQPGLQAGEPDLLLGKPVHTDNNIATVAASARVAVFGDIAKAYIIRDVEGISTKILNELYAVNGQVGFRTSIRTDGAVRDSAAAKALVIKT